MLGLLGLISIILFPIGLLLLAFKAGRAILSVLFSNHFGIFLLIIILLPPIDNFLKLFGFGANDVARWIILGFGFATIWIFKSLLWLINFICGV